MSKRKRRNGGFFNTFTTCISTTLVLLLLGGVVLSLAVATGFSRAVQENFTVEVLLDDSIPQPALKAMEKELKAKPYARRVNYISKAQGTAEMAKVMDAAPDEFLGYSPIPAEFEMYLNADYANKDSLGRYMPALKSTRYVTDVVYPLDLMDTVNEKIKWGSVILLSLAVLLAVVSFSLINNTVRMSIYARRFSIRTMKLVGAKWSFIRRPFLRQAFGIGFVSATIAAAALGAGMYAIAYYNVNTEFQPVTPIVAVMTIGSVYVFGLLMTVLCAFFSVNKHLRMSDDKMFTN